MEKNPASSCFLHECVIRDYRVIHFPECKKYFFFHHSVVVAVYLSISLYEEGDSILCGHTPSFILLQCGNLLDQVGCFCAVKPGQCLKGGRSFVTSRRGETLKSEDHWAEDHSLALNPMLK